MEFTFYFNYRVHKRSEPDEDNRSFNLIRVIGPVEITVADVPEDKVREGEPDPAVVTQAENSFLQNLPLDQILWRLVDWEMHYSSPEGPILSRFSMTGPYPDD